MDIPPDNSPVIPLLNLRQISVRDTYCTQPAGARVTCKLIFSIKENLQTAGCLVCELFYLY